MALFTMNIYSICLGMQTKVNVIIPQKNTSGQIGVEENKEDKGFKCLYLLHGLSDDETIWLRRTSIERYAQKYGICVVMPCGDRSFYTDMKYGMKYYSFISEELPRLISEFFHVSDKKEDTFIAGLSMGGYGALKMALRNPSKYAKVAGLSSVADIKGTAERFHDTYVPIFGEDVNIPEEDDLFYLSEKCNKNSEKPEIFLGVGTEDFLYEYNQKFKKHLESIGYEFTYRESKGVHNWDFWDEYIQYVLEWMFD